MKHCTLPVTRPDLDSKEWEVLLSPWRHYYAIDRFVGRSMAVYVGKRVSHIDSPMGIVSWTIPIPRVASISFSKDCTALTSGIGAGSFLIRRA